MNYRNNSSKQQSSKQSAYRSATEAIGLAVAEKLEQQKRLIASPVPVNALTGVPYTGVNIFLLLGDAAANKRPSNRYIGESQARKMGMQPLKTDRGIEIWRPYFVKEEVDEQLKNPDGTPATNPDGTPLMGKVEKEKFVGCGTINVYSFDALVSLDDQPAEALRPVAVPTLRQNDALREQLRRDIPVAIRAEHDSRVKAGSKSFDDIEVRLCAELGIDLALVSAGIDPEPFLPIAKSQEMADHLRKSPARISPCLGLATRAVKAYALAHPGLMPVFEIERPDFNAAQASTSPVSEAPATAPIAQASPPASQTSVKAKAKPKPQPVDDESHASAEIPEAVALTSW